MHSSGMRCSKKNMKERQKEQKETIIDRIHKSNWRFSNRNEYIHNKYNFEPIGI